MATLSPEQLEALAHQFFYVDDSAQLLADQLNAKYQPDLTEHKLVFAVAMVFSVPIDDLEDAHMIEPPRAFKAYEIPMDNQQQLELFEWLHQYNEALRANYLERRRHVDQIMLGTLNTVRKRNGNPEIEVFSNAVVRASEIVLVPRPTVVKGPNGTQFVK